MSSLAYFLSKDTIDQFNTLIKPIVYLSMFYFFNNPRSSITDNYIILVALVYSVTGIAYAFANFFQPSSAQLVGSAVFFKIWQIFFTDESMIFAVVCASAYCFDSDSHPGANPECEDAGQHVLPKVGSRGLCRIKCWKVWAELNS